MAGKPKSPFRDLTPDQLQRAVKTIERALAGNAEALARVLGPENGQILAQLVGHVATYTDGTLQAVRAMEEAVDKAPFEDARRQFLLLNVRSWWVDPSAVSRTAKMRMVNDALREAQVVEEKRRDSNRRLVEQVRMPGEGKAWSRPDWENGETSLQARTA
jgi:hypothetical protein